MRKRITIECEPCGDQKTIKVSISPDEPEVMWVETIDWYCLRCMNRQFKLVRDETQKRGKTPETSHETASESSTDALRRETMRRAGE